MGWTQCFLPPKQATQTNESTPSSPSLQHMLDCLLELFKHFNVNEKLVSHGPSLRACTPTPMMMVISARAQPPCLFLKVKSVANSSSPPLPHGTTQVVSDGDHTTFVFCLHFSLSLFLNITFSKRHQFWDHC